MNKKRPSIKQLKFEKYTYVFLMTICFTTRIGDLIIPQIIPRVASIIILVYTLIRYKKYTLYSKKRTDICIYLLKIYLIPAILIHLYSIVMTLLGQMDFAYLNTNLSAYAPIIIAVSSIYLFGNKAIEYNFLSIILSWCLSITSALVTKGIGIIPFAIAQAYLGDFTPILGVELNYFELHDIVLSLGLLAIYYFYSNGKILKDDLPILVIFASIYLLGMKRISLLGLVCSIVYILFINKIRRNHMEKIIFISGILIALASIAFIVIIFNNSFQENIGGVDLMGRNYYYNTIKKYGTLSPTFLGTGRNSVTKILTTKHTYLHVAGVHSDILKMYIENGFIVFFAWLWYYLIKLPKLLKNKFGMKTAALYMSLTLYTFIIYLTDNVENYYIFQILLTSLPAGYYITQHSKTKKKSYQYNIKFTTGIKNKIIKLCNHNKTKE